MGLFNWGKKKSVDESGPAPAATPSKPTPNAAQAPAAPSPSSTGHTLDISISGRANPVNTPESVAEIDRLCAEGKAGRPEVADELWTKVLGLSTWYVPAKVPGSDMDSMVYAQPFCGVVDGRPTLMVFSTGDRARTFAVANKLPPGPGGSPVVMAYQAQQGAALAITLLRSGVQCVAIDGGAFISSLNMPLYFSLARGLPLAEASRRLGSDPMLDLGLRINSQTTLGDFERNLAEYIEELFKLDKLYSFELPGYPNVPATTPDEKLGVRALFFTSMELAERAAVLSGVVPRDGGNVTFFTMQMSELMAWLEGAQAHGLGCVSTNEYSYGGVRHVVTLLTELFAERRAGG